MLKAGGSKRLSFWRRDHKVTPRKSLEALFDTSESEEVPDGGSTPIQSSEEEEPDTQDDLFIKGYDETTSDGEYEPTHESLEFSDSGENDPKESRYRTPELSAERKRAMQTDPRLTPAYFEGKDNEGEQVRAGMKVPVQRQRTPDYDPSFKGREFQHGQRKGRGVNPEEVVSDGDEVKPARKTREKSQRATKSRRDNLDDMPSLVGSSTEEGDESMGEDKAGSDEGESYSEPEESPKNADGGGGDPDEDPSSGDDRDAGNAGDDSTESTESSGEYRAELKRLYAEHAKRKRERKKSKRRKLRKKGTARDGHRHEVKKKKHPKHRRRKRREYLKDLRSATSSDSGNSEEEEGYYGFEQSAYADYSRAMRRAYDPFDLKGVEAPTLHDGDRGSRARFRVKYLDYVAKHKQKMRKRAPEDRVLPQAVVECIKPSLLTYICKHLLAEEKRTDKPEEVRAIVIHRWVMKRTAEALSAEANEGMTKVKALKLELTGEQGVKNVQRAFINLTEIRDKYRLKTKEKEIIRLLAYNIKPDESRMTVQNYLKAESEEATQAGLKISKFHDLLMDMAITFEKAHELGLKAKPPKSSGNGDKGGNKTNSRKGRGNREGRGNKNNSKQKEKGGSGDGKPSDGDNNPKSEKQRIGEKLKAKGLVGKCLHCGGDHRVGSCPTIPPEKKDWTVRQHLIARGIVAKGDRHSSKGNPANRGNARNARSKGSAEKTTDPGGENNSGGSKTADPGGAASKNFRGTVKAAMGAEPRPAEGLGADGTAVVGGVPGFYCCDGGCDQATTSPAYAAELEKAGVKVHYYDKAKPAKLCDGSIKDSILGYCLADVELAGDTSWCCHSPANTY